MRGLVQGFRIGFNWDSCVLRPPWGNFESVTGNPSTICRYIAEASGRMVGSHSPTTWKNLIGLISWPHQLGKFQLIVLALPGRLSVLGSLRVTWVWASSSPSHISLCQARPSHGKPQDRKGPSTTLNFSLIHNQLRAAGAQIFQGQMCISEDYSVSLGLSATKHELQVLIGQINHAATVGQCFLQQLIETIKRSCLQSQCRINLKCIAD